MGLSEYKKKRNFNETNEPDTGENTSGGTLKFVVQRHHASRLHYDFRLELEGVLKSWAVPKGPSLNPKDKRLAMQVEDHPFDYRTFEGVIPEGNYGAGVVSIFDEGTYEPIEGQDEKDLKKGLYSGNLKFRLHGNVLNGEFALVKIKFSEDNSWLLIKHRDEYSTDKKFDSESLVSDSVKQQGERHKQLAKEAKNNVNIDTSAEDNLQRESFKPMLAKLVDNISDDKNWIFEKKFDGYRAIAFKNGRSIKLVSRNGTDFTKKYPTVKEALSKLSADTILDGELVAEDNAGKEMFHNLQNYKPSNKNITLRYYVFDLLALNGHDTRQLPLIQRKELLKTLITGLNSPEIVYNEHSSGDGENFLKKAEQNGWEGIIAKDANGLYESDKRSGSWKKFKLKNSQEAIIIGFSKPAGSRKYLGSLVLALYENQNLVYIGNCGTGFSEESLKEIYNQLVSLKSEKKPVKEKVKQEKSVTWVKPELICEVFFSEWTSDRQMRHPVFKGLRNDKKPKEIKLEVSDNKIRKETIEQQTAASVRSSKQKDIDFPDEIEEKFGKISLKLTSLNKFYWKNEGIKKGQLIQYYRSIANYILPYLKNRPLSLNRHPNGVDAAGFFQKDLDTEQIPPWIKYATIHSESNDRDIDYLICNDLPTLLWMVNLGCIEINPWLSSYRKIENPVFAVLDLDPNDVDDFNEVVKVAQTAKAILDEMGIVPYIKTSGSRGLHIFIHLGEKYTYEIVKNFVQYIASLVHERHPVTTSLERSPSKRKKKIYLDFLQNRRGQTIAAPYSARPKPGATVSTPLSWDEVNETLDIKQFTIFNTCNRIDEKGDLWNGITKEKTDLKVALSRFK